MTWLLLVAGVVLFGLGVQQGRVIERERMIRDDPILRKYD